MRSSPASPNSPPTLASGSGGAPAERLTIDSAPAGNSPPPAGQGRNMEQSLRSQVRAGEPDAFGVLFDEHSRAVYNLAFRLIGNWHQAEEVVSLTFFEAWRLRTRIEPDG